MTRRSGTLRAYGPPFWADAMFWIAAALSLLVGALVVVILLMLLSTPRTGAGWLWTIGLGLLGVWIGFVVLSLGLNTSRGIELGASQADAERGDRFEAHGRRAGRVVGSGLAKATGRSRTKDDAPTSEPTPDVEPSPKVTIDRSARVLGQMVGRRIAERREQKDPS